MHEMRDMFSPTLQIMTNSQPGRHNHATNEVLNVIKAKMTSHAHLETGEELEAGDRII